MDALPVPPVWAGGAGQPRLWYPQHGEHMIVLPVPPVWAGGADQPRL